MNSSPLPSPNSAQQPLIAAAAKAAGLIASWDVYRGFVLNGTATSWNPWVDDGHAMLIASKLLMSLQLDHDGAKAWIGEDAISVNNGGNPYAELREAIVRLAADRVRT
jgi:hypothetical protein